MKIVLICNTALPVIEEAFALPKAKPESWLVAHVEALKQSAHSVIVCFPLPDEAAHISENIAGITAESYTNDKDGTVYNQGAEKEFLELFQKEQPDIIHVFGTEFPHTLAAVNAAQKCNMLSKLVISIQGLVSVIGQYHYYAGLPGWMHHAKTFRDFIRRDSIARQRALFLKKGQFEKEAIKKAKHIIGRTDWDRACVTQINPAVQYHFCNETLRETFYQNTWQRNACQEHSIFVSQASYPLKGFHAVLDALAILVKKYPDAHVYTTGADPREQTGFSSKLRQRIYTKYLIKKIRDLGLDQNVSFLGYLDEKQMCERFLKSHVFVSASSIENSSNSLGEAMLLGVPSISSNVGGTQNLLEHGKEGYLYPFDEPYMIAYYADRIFSSDALANQLSRNAREHASRTHDRDINAKTMQDIYWKIGQNRGKIL